jgi:hypothetical protein
MHTYKKYMYICLCIYLCTGICMYVCVCMCMHVLECLCFWGSMCSHIYSPRGAHIACQPQVRQGAFVWIKHAITLTKPILTAWGPPRRLDRAADNRWNRWNRWNLATFRRQSRKLFPPNLRLFARNWCSVAGHNGLSQASGIKSSHKWLSRVSVYSA